MWAVRAPHHDASPARASGHRGLAPITCLIVLIHHARPSPPRCADIDEKQRRPPHSEILITLSLTLYPRPWISLMDSDTLQISSGAMASEVVSLVAQVRTQKASGRAVPVLPRLIELFLVLCLVYFQAAGLGLLLSFIYFQIIKFYYTMFRLRHLKGPFAIPVVGNLYHSEAFSVSSIRMTGLRVRPR